MEAAPDAPAPAAPDASAAPLQQPDFHRLQQYLAGVVEQIGLLPNMPAVVGFNAIIVNLREQHDQALAQRAQQHAAALAQQAEHHAAALAQAAQQAQHHEAALAQQAERHQELIERLDALRDGQSRLPMQLQNAIASLDAPLQYPPNVVVGPQFPTTKKLLLKLTIARAQAVSQALGLPALPPNSHLAARRQQIIDYLGCAMRA